MHSQKYRGLRNRNQSNLTHVYVSIRNFMISSLIVMGLISNASAGFGNYDLGIYGNATSLFWEHNYYTTQSYNNPPNTLVTHTGKDFQLGINASHVDVQSYGFGKIININYGLGALTVRHLIDNGKYVNTNLLHLHAGSIVVANNTYIAKHQLLGQEGNTGLGFNNLDTNTHLHLEVAGQVSLAWVPTASTCPGFGCNANERTNNYDLGNMNAHYRIASNTMKGTPFGNRVWYDPDIFATYVELLPYMSMVSSRPSSVNYEVYGVAGQTINASLNLSGTFNRSAIVVRDYFSRNRPGGLTDQGGLVDIQQRLLGGPNANALVNGINASNSYGTGDYLFAAWLEDGVETRYGYPVKFSFVDNGDIIVDNDQQNADGITTNDSLTQPVYNGSVGSKVPGYFLTADLHSGRSGTFAQWKPNQSGIYEVYVHIPEYGATATSVSYKIRADGTDATLIFSDPVNQSAKAGQWVRLTTANNPASVFQFNNLGFIGLSLDSNNLGAGVTPNFSISASQNAAFDAVKFVKIGASQLPNISLSMSATSFTTGNSFTLTRTMTSGSPAANADIYVGLQLPDGTLLIMQPNGSFSSAITPKQANVPVPNATDTVLNYTFTGAESAGTYTWLAALMQPGTTNVIGTIVSQSFTFIPASSAPQTLVTTGNTSVRNALISPNGGETWVNGVAQSVRWNASQVTGGAVNIYVLHDNSLGLLDPSIPNLGDLVNIKMWFQFASNVPNTGVYTVDPITLSGTGNAYLVLIVSADNNASWDISDGMFSLNFP